MLNEGSLEEINNIQYISLLHALVNIDVARTKAGDYNE